jgi:hypothetical protein
MAVDNIHDIHPGVQQRPYSLGQNDPRNLFFPSKKFLQFGIIKLIFCDSDFIPQNFLQTKNKEQFFADEK